jgi:DNA replication regulator SLD2
MKDEEKQELLKRSETLRKNLKVWEKEYAAVNDGQKPSRDAVKKNPDIGELKEPKIFISQAWI